MTKTSIGQKGLGKLSLLNLSSIATVEFYSHSKKVGMKIVMTDELDGFTCQYLNSLKPLVLGNSSKMYVGDTVIAIGNPFGLSDTMTTGIVSGIGRSLPTSASGGFSIPNVIQTDAPIDPGSSCLILKGK